MNIFIDTLSAQAHLLLFQNDKTIVDVLSWGVKGKESSTLIPQIDILLKRNHINYKDLENIVVVNGPGSFTGVRTTVLVANTINYIIQKNMIPLSYFDLYQNYPIIKSSSKRDCFIQFQKESAIEIMKNEEILEQLYKMNMKIIYGNATLSFFGQGGLRKGGDIKIVDKVNYESIIRNIDISKTGKCKKIDPLYIKKPNIS